MIDRRTLVCTLMAAAVALTLSACGKQADTTVDKAATEAKDKMVAAAKDVEGAAKELEAKETAIDAYVYAYSLVTIEMTRRGSTNVVEPGVTTAPMGQFAKFRSYPTAEFQRRLIRAAFSFVNSLTVLG